MVPLSSFAQVKERHNLDAARQSYHQAVRTYGKQSPQALVARSSVRQARKSYHAVNRQNRRPVPAIAH